MASVALHPRSDSDFPARIAARLLDDLGALPDLRTPRAQSSEDARAAIPSGACARPQFPGLPTGTLDTAHGYAAAGAALMAPYLADGLPGDGARAAVLLPLALADAEGRPRPPRSQPRTIGTGALCADVTSPDEEELFARLLDTMGPSERADPERVADVGQSWRLAVLPYRFRRDADAGRASEGASALARVSRICAPCESSSDFRLVRHVRPLSGLTVCDLSTMWAGPLATTMLGNLGASVVKVEMPTRPDGMRRAFAADPDSTSSSAMFTALNSGKRLVQLDLRQVSDRARFERLLAKSDLLVESFSRRVMPNLGYPEEALRAIRPGLLIAAVRAFPPGENAAWSAYGSGIHAASGLADLGHGRFGAACVSYPDPLAGIALFAAMAGQVVSRERTGRASTLEVSLWDALRPLLDLPQPGELELEPAAEQLLELAHMPGPDTTSARAS